MKKKKAATCDSRQERLEGGYLEIRDNCFILQPLFTLIAQRNLFVKRGEYDTKRRIKEKCG